MSGPSYEADFSIDGMSVTGMARVIGRFQGAAARLYRQLNGIVEHEAEEIAALARGRIGELFKNPALMQSAVQANAISEVGGSSGTAVATVSASGLPYMRIHEYGGVVMTPDIFPRQAIALHFFAPGWAGFTASRSEAATSEVFAKRASGHPTVIPERSYLRYALAQRSRAIQEAFQQAARASVKP